MARITIDTDNLEYLTPENDRERSYVSGWNDALDRVHLQSEEVEETEIEVIYHYSFKSGVCYDLIGRGFSLEAYKALINIHGNVINQSVSHRRINKDR